MRTKPSMKNVMKAMTKHSFNYTDWLQQRFLILDRLVILR
jgi:hypothetical protein